MVKKEKKPNVCPRCGTEVPNPTKTWNFVSPLPDDKGRITITVMGSYKCPNCGYSWKAAISKLKVGGGEVEIDAGGKEKKIAGEAPKQKPEEIELDLEDIINEDDINEE
ncbi:hypothetical protein [Fervidicoccus fontis]|uniref:Chromatin protein Cren7 n=2 Tax=Fervidicoccus fontis TaxID=683846 RepID=H9ZZG9_FERFK|nr:hypothetical protein [Fervidicoccus fontis]AFH42126.1 hypothetical protein FFONT_0134 [Fervidicoccus fontis Kam940]PMB78037.1 MAG: 30S ribosomal protein S27ae [Fervidicoccus fontis]HEW64460.1 chromatin protein Cren7 [Fervidicoccus fontis]